MELYVVLYFIPALVVMGIAKLYFHWSYTWKEFAVQVTVTLAVLVGLFALGGISQTRDIQLINGVVTQLDPRQQSCPSGWRSTRDSFCTEYRTREVYSHTTCSGSGSSRTCTRHYDTEYNYIFPWERRYFVRTDIPKQYEISRVDRQGASVPPRFAEISLGDPVTVEETYTNYIRGASSSLFAEERPVESVPIAYPRVRDYYRVNRLIISGYQTDNSFHEAWNESLAVLNSNVRSTRANVIVGLTGNNQDFGEALARAWEAHNINDVVVVIGMNGETSDEISWVDVRSWSNNSLVEVEIENDILNIGTLDTTRINDIIENAVMDHFELRPMEDFEYLADDISPPLWAHILAVLVLLLVTPGITYMFHRYEVI